MFTVRIDDDNRGIKTTQNSNTRQQYEKLEDSDKNESILRYCSRREWKE